MAVGFCWFSFTEFDKFTSLILLKIPVRKTLEPPRIESRQCTTLHSITPIDLSGARAPIPTWPWPKPLAAGAKVAQGKR